MRPTFFQVGKVLYWVIQTRNPDTMVLKDADSTPSVAVRKNGSSVADSVTVTKRSATTGIYDCSYDPASEVEGDAFTLEESATVTGTTTSSATYTQTWSCRVAAIERGTDGANTIAPLTTLGANAPVNWLDAAAVKADAVTKIQNGLSTATNVSDSQTAVLAKLPTSERAAGASTVALLPSAAVIVDAVWDESRSEHTTAGTFGFYLDAAISSRLAPTVSGRTLNVSAGGAGDAVLDSGALLNTLGLEAGNLDEQLADILAASGGGGGGEGFTEEQTALLVSIARWAARNNGGPMHYTGNVGDGGVLELTINDDHETAIENDLPIVVKDPDGLLHAKLTASGATLSWSAGQDNVGGLITGTVTAPTHDEDTGLTTIVVQVPNCTASGNITAPYQWQLKRTSGGKIKTELRGTLRINPDMS